jgi:tetratricopeptide (TPR) repeat protein
VSTALRQANILYELERFDEAIELLNKAGTENPSDPESFVLMAWSYYRSQRASVGFKVASHALSLAPESTRALIIHSACASYIGKDKLASKSLDLAMALEPNNDFAHYHRAFQFAKLRKYREALDSINTANSIEPNSPVYLAFQSQIQLILGQNSEAKNSALEALKLNPEASYGHTQLGKVQRGEGDYQSSASSLIEALRNNPNNRAARDELLETFRCRFPPYAWVQQLDFCLGGVPYWKRALFWTSPLSVGSIFVLAYCLLIANELHLLARVALGVSVFYGLLFLMRFILKHMAFVFLDGLVAFNPEVSFALPQEQRLLSKISVVMLAIGTCLLTIGILFQLVPMTAIGSAILVCCFMIAYIYSLALQR